MYRQSEKRSVRKFWSPSPQQISTGFASWLRYCSDVAQRKSTKLCAMFGRLLGCYTRGLYIHFRGLLPPDGIWPGAIFTLHPSLAFSYIRSVTARHSSSGRQPNFAALYKKFNYGIFADGATYIRLVSHHVGIGPHSSHSCLPMAILLHAPEIRLSAADSCARL